MKKIIACAAAIALALGTLALVLHLAGPDFEAGIDRCQRAITTETPILIEDFNDDATAERNEGAAPGVRSYNFEGTLTSKAGTTHEYSCISTWEGDYWHLWTTSERGN